VADGEIRICVPIPDVINGQFDEGLKLFLGMGGEGSPKDLTVETNKLIISSPRYCLHDVRPDRSQRSIPWQ
jgi:hypothetical protein